jgi:2-keto-4-pentenoate hydratase/2-oxohepta-3-ene-1,7-dioic acid hydratase in catechol pathway
MKLATYRYEDGIGPGLVIGERIADLRSLSPDLAGLLRSGAQALATAGKLAEDGGDVTLEPERLLAPIPEPRLFLGVGLNYRDHAAETGRALGEFPTLFAKLPGSAAAPYAEVACAQGVTTLDYEGEIGLVIGARARCVRAEDAAAHIAGLVVVNDLTVRAWSRPETLLLAKNVPGHAPFGPWITTLDEAGDPHHLGIQTWVNGELRQSSSSAEMHRTCWELIALISAAIPLEPGDIITTGSPAGSGAGFDPPRFLRHGDEVRVEVEGLGSIRNRIVAEQQTAGALP